MGCISGGGGKGVLWSPLPIPSFNMGFSVGMHEVCIRVCLIPTCYDIEQVILKLLLIGATTKRKNESDEQETPKVKKTKYCSSQSE